ncbi:MAG: transporter substrate-binding domain-containing protein [Bdellovibrio sp.]|nr:transporter substrate-binding domain-containing protein [Bdellovibrio sp.]
MKAYILLITLILSSVAAKADTIELRSDTWCPYVCDNKTNPGYMIEAFVRIFEKHGHKVNVKIVNWARAVNETRLDKATVIVGAMINDAPDFVFPAKSFGSGDDYFYVPKESNWSYTGAASLKGKRVGVINGYAYGGKVDDLIRKRKDVFISISGEHPLDQLFRMIDSKRLDAFIENDAVFRYTLEALKLNPDDYKRVSENVADDPRLWAAFSPKNKKSEEYGKIFSKGIVELRQSGELNKILNKYGLTDWEPTHTVGSK